MNGGTQTVRVEATLERWLDLVFGGDRHVVGWTPGGWVVTPPVSEQLSGLVDTFGGKRFRLGERATSLEEGAIAAARSMMRAQAVDDDVVQRALDRTAQSLRDVTPPQARPLQNSFDFESGSGSPTTASSPG